MEEFQIHLCFMGGFQNCMYTIVEKSFHCSREIFYCQFEGRFSLFHVRLLDLGKSLVVSWNCSMEVSLLQNADILKVFSFMSFLGKVFQVSCQFYGRFSKFHVSSMEGFPSFMSVLWKVFQVSCQFCGRFSKFHVSSRGGFPSFMSEAGKGFKVLSVLWKFSKDLCKFYLRMSKLSFVSFQISGIFSEFRVGFRKAFQFYVHSREYFWGKTSLSVFQNFMSS